MPETARERSKEEKGDIQHDLTPIFVIFTTSNLFSFVTNGIGPKNRKFIMIQIIQLGRCCTECLIISRNMIVVGAAGVVSF